MKQSLSIVGLRTDEIVQPSGLELILGGSREEEVCVQNSCVTNSGNCTVNRCNINQAACESNSCSDKGASSDTIR